jgi:hypothetical protein
MTQGAPNGGCGTGGAETLSLAPSSRFFPGDRHHPPHPVRGLIEIRSMRAAATIGGVALERPLRGSLADQLLVTLPHLDVHLVGDH